MINNMDVVSISSDSDMELCSDVDDDATRSSSSNPAAPSNPVRIKQPYGIMQQQPYVIKQQ
jgi:hypothetical protein